MVYSKRFEVDAKYSQYWPYIHSDFDGKRRYTPLVVDDVVTHWQQNGLLQCQLGTYMHEAIEDFYNGNSSVVMRKSVSDEEYKQFLVFHQDVVVRRQWVPYRTEWKIWDARSQIAGTIDMIFVDQDGQFHMVDWKRSKEIRKKGSRCKGACSGFRNCNYDKYSIQLNIYAYILSRNYDTDIASMALGVFHPTQSRYQLIDIPRRVDDIIRIVQASMSLRGIEV